MYQQTANWRCALESKGKVEGYIGVVTAWILSKMLIDENVAGVANRENIREPNVCSALTIKRHQMLQMKKRQLNLFK